MHSLGATVLYRLETSKEDTAEVNTSTTSPQVETSTKTQPSSKKTVEEVRVKPRCDLCSIFTTCQVQMDMHLVGKAHKQKVKVRDIPDFRSVFSLFLFVLLLQRTLSACLPRLGSFRL